VVKIVVGGTARKAGKTTVICRLLRGFPDTPWLVVKISPHIHGPSSEGWTLEEEHKTDGSGDTRRYLAAGARRSFWLRGDVDAAWPALEELLASHAYWIVETTQSAARLDADLALLVETSEGAATKAATSVFPAAARIRADEAHLIERVLRYWKE
jgi:hypothetical protein